MDALLLQLYARPFEGKYRRRIVPRDMCDTVNSDLDAAIAASVAEPLFIPQEV
jgi:hypothetical protein